MGTWRTLLDAAQDRVNQGVIDSWITASASSSSAPQARSSTVSALDSFSVAPKPRSKPPNPQPDPLPTRAPGRGDLHSSYTPHVPTSSSPRQPDPGESSPPMVTCRQDLEPPSTSDAAITAKTAPGVASLAALSDKLKLMQTQQAPPKLATLSTSVESRGAPLLVVVCSLLKVSQQGSLCSRV
jgi:hypothetical protein